MRQLALALAAQAVLLALPAVARAAVHAHGHRRVAHLLHELLLLRGHLRAHGAHALRRGHRALHHAAHHGHVLRLKKPLPRVARMQEAAAHLRASGYLAAQASLATVNVSFEAREAPGNAQGVPQPACTLCGDCNTGCNVGAKNTVLMNYLPDAHNHGADIFCQVEVQSIAPGGAGGGWTANCQLVGKDAREYQLDRSIRALAEAYEIVLIDCPPSLGLLTLNALTAADAVLIPLQCEYYALEGLANLTETVDLVRQQLNPRLDIQGIVLTMADQRNNLARQVEAEVRSHFGEKVYRTRIPRNVRLSEAPSHGQPILLYDIHSKGAVAYQKLAEELLGQLALTAPPRKPPVLPVGNEAEVPLADAIEPSPNSTPPTDSTS